MIQRKQSLFLLAAAIIHVILLFVPVVTASSVEVRESYSLLIPKGSFQVTPFFTICVILNAAGLIASLGVTFMYTQRLRQRISCFIVMVFQDVLAVLLIAFPLLQNGNEEKSIVIYLPMLAGIFSFLAAHFIKKDIELLKSADRIR
jgi:hypothetical protein